MAVALQVLGGTTFPTAVTCQKITGLPTGASAGDLQIRIEGTVDLYIVQDGVTVDGAALPAHYSRIPANVVDYYDITSGDLLVAAAGVGVATIRLVHK